MITQRSLADNYIAIRQGIEFYYFGKGCIADYFTSTIGYLDETDITIIKYCNGALTLNDIFIKLKYIDGETLKDRINIMRKKGIIVFKTEPLDIVPVFWGKKDYYYPKTMAVELLSNCNYYCPFCYKNANSKGILISDKTIFAINKIIKNNVHNILLTGGEPTLHPNYLKYIDIFSEYARVYIITNGSLIYLHDSNTLKKLDHIQFSIYGCNDEEYKKMTGSDTGFADLCKSLEFSKNHDISTVASVTFCESTFGHMEDFFKLAKYFGVDVLRVGVADSFGRGERAYNNDLKYHVKLDEAFKELIVLKRKYSKEYRIDFPNIKTEHLNKREDLKQFVYKDTFDCGCGSEYIVVSQEGKIRPCQMLSEKFFSYDKNLEALEEHINGDFHKAKLFECVNKFYEVKCKDKELPCHALRSYVNINI